MRILRLISLVRSQTKPKGNLERTLSLSFDNKPVANCGGKRKKATMANIHELMALVTYTAVVARKRACRLLCEAKERRTVTGMTQKRAIKAILNPFRA